MTVLPWPFVIGSYLDVKLPKKIIYHDWSVLVFGMGLAHYTVMFVASSRSLHFIPDAHELRL